jgi:diguanylate cyclase (GGDEF)-like protein
VLEEEFHRHHRVGADLAVILIDIDFFKSVNDQHGHQVGDQVLIAMANVLRAGTRQVDVVGRWGGEEFLVVCRDTDLNGATMLAEKLRTLIATEHFPVVGSKTASFGVASLRADDTPHTLVSCADEALYRAKNAGRNRVKASRLKPDLCTT